MSMNKRIATVALVCALALGFACDSDAAAYPMYGNPAFAGQLSPEQMAEAKKIFDESYASMQATRQALAVKRAELDTQLASPTPDKSKIESLSREIGDLRGKMLAARVEVRSQLEKKGLPSDYYAPDAPYRGNWHGGPEVWHHGGHGRGWGGRGGCGGCYY